MPESYSYTVFLDHNHFWMSIQVHSSAIIFDPQSDKMDQEDQKCDINNLVSSSNLVGGIALNKDESFEFQEGGIRGWATVIGAILIQFCGFGYSNAFGVFQDYYTRIYITNESSSTIAWIGGVNAFLIFVSGIFAGVLYDRGYFYHLLYGASFLTSLSLFMLSLIKPNHLYQETDLGYVICSSRLFTRHLDPPYPAKQSIVSGWVRQGDTSQRCLEHIYTRDRLYSPASSTAHSGVKAPIMKSIRQFYKEWPFIMISLGPFFFMIGFYYPFVYLQLDASMHGMNEKFTFYVLVIMNASSLAGRLSPGFFAHSLGVLPMTVASAICCSALILSMVVITSATGFVVIAVLFGYASGIYVGLEAPFIAALTPDISELGARLGMAYVFCALGALVGPPIHGALLSSNFVWWRPAVGSGISALIGASCFGSLLFLKKPRESQVLA